MTGSDPQHSASPRTGAEHPHKRPERAELKRSLSHGQMTMIVMGSALGTGLFLGSGGQSPWPGQPLFSRMLSVRRSPPS